MKNEYRDKSSKFEFSKGGSIGGGSLHNTRSLKDLHLDSYKVRAKDFFTPVVKKELTFTEEEQVL